MASITQLHMATESGRGIVEGRKAQKQNFAQVSAVESTSVAQPVGAAATRLRCTHNVVCVCVCVVQR